MARTIKNDVKGVLNENEHEIINLMRTHGIINKVQFQKVKRALQEVLERGVRKHRAKAKK